MARILVTGASDGLGRALAESLADRGHELVLHGRDPQRLAAVAEKTGGVALRADLADLAQVRGLARAVADRYDTLDVLVNNAGVGFGEPGAPRELSADGNELRFAVNYLAPAPLSRLLLPLLRRAGAARIVNVASIGQHDVDLDDLMFERGYDGVAAYRRAKLALIADTFDLAEELAGTGVTVNALHPATLMPTTMVRDRPHRHDRRPGEGPGRDAAAGRRPGAGRRDRPLLRRAARGAGAGAGVRPGVPRRVARPRRRADQPLS